MGCSAPNFCSWAVRAICRTRKRNRSYREAVEGMQACPSPSAPSILARQAPDKAHKDTSTNPALGPGAIPLESGRSRHVPHPVAGAAASRSARQSIFCFPSPIPSRWEQTLAQVRLAQVELTHAARYTRTGASGRDDRNCPLRRSWCALLPAALRLSLHRHQRPDSVHLAIDRTDEAVAHLYDPMHPAVLRLWPTSLLPGREQGKSVSVCGRPQAM